MPRQTALGAQPHSLSAGQIDPLRRVRHPSTGAYAIPIFSFGNPLLAKVATISLNPSHQEFLNGAGASLSTSSQRFSTPWLNGTQTVASIQADCNNYFNRTTNRKNTYYKRWFSPMEQLLTHPNTVTKKLSYLNGNACHLDLSPWHSNPAWSGL